jgi:hypothetical protein
MRAANGSHFKITPQLVQPADGCMAWLAMLLILRGKVWHVADKFSMALKMPSSKSDSYWVRRKIGDEWEQC